MSEERTARTIAVDCVIAGQEFKEGKKLPATFTPGARLGAGLAETVQAMQRVVDDQGLAAPVTVRTATAKVG